GPDFWWDWHANLDGKIAATGQRIIFTGMANMVGIFDVDGDGDLDGVAEEPMTGANFWTENDGVGNFANGAQLCECGPRPIGGGDLNGDGIPDLLLDGFRDGVPRWIDGVTREEHDNIASTQRLQPGDANRDFRFDAADLVLAAQGGKFGVDVDATWREGDWDGAPGEAPASPPIGDRRFNQQDLDEAFATGLYERGLYLPSDRAPIDGRHALELEWGRHDYRLIYEQSSGKVSVRTDAAPMTSLHLTSESGLFLPIDSFNGPFDIANDVSLFQFAPTSEVMLELGAILPANLPWQTVLDDLKISGSRVGGGSLGSVGFDCVGCAVDIDELQAAVLEDSDDLRFDLDGNQQIDFGDVRRLVNELLQSKFGDANRDGVFGSLDLVTVFQAGGYQDDIAGNATWSTGDWNGDADFTSEDLVLAMQVGAYEGHSPQPFAAVHRLTLLEPHDHVRAIQAVDVDNDGDLDVVIGRYSSQDIGGGSRIDWFENADGELFRRHPIENNLARVSSIDSADIDGDGDLDLVASSIDDDTITWFENTDGQGSFGPQRTIWQGADFALSVDTGDIDQDGDQDVLSSSLFNHEIVWYENLDSQGAFDTPRIVRRGQRGDYEAMVRTGDIDGDGDLDVVSANGTSVSWSENDGNGQFLEHEIGLVGDSPLVRRHILSVAVADADGDGDLDVFAGDAGAGRVSWYENTNGQGTFGNEIVISNSALDVRTVSTADLDNDDDLETLVGTYYGQLEWFEGLPDEPRFGPAHAIAANTSFGVFAVVDFDQDGDADVISTGSNSLLWYENQTIT
ncbi:MAG: VCBS repeat-containing protein, partial [Planctomycetales bacterium]|nr:VCBS repeat-containing protein [Planctomycetales bacterium]